MLERMLMVLIVHPWIASGAGHALMSLASVMAVLGVRFDRLGGRLAKVLSGSGVEVPDVVSSLPWWIRFLTAKTTEHWVLVVLFFACGAYLVWVGRWLKKVGA